MSGDAAQAALVAALDALPARVAAAARAADALEPATADPDAWPIRTVLLHLVLVDEHVWQRRLHDLDGGGIPFWAYTEPDLADGPGEASLDDLLAKFGRARAATLGIVVALDDKGWARRGVHETFGELDVAGLLREVLRHDEEHLADLERRAGRGD